MRYDQMVEMLTIAYVDRSPWWRRMCWWLRQHSPWRRRGYTRAYTPTVPSADHPPPSAEETTLVWEQRDNYVGLQQVRFGGQDRRLYPGLEIRPRPSQKERPHQWRASNQHRRRYRHTATIRRPKTSAPGAGATPADTSGATGS